MYVNRLRIEIEIFAKRAAAQIFAKNLCHLKSQISPERGPQLRSLSYFNLLPRQNPLLFFTSFFHFLEYFLKSS